MGVTGIVPMTSTVSKWSRYMSWLFLLCSYLCASHRSPRRTQFARIHDALNVIVICLVSPAARVTFSVFTPYVSCHA